MPESHGARLAKLFSEAEMERIATILESDFRSLETEEIDPMPALEAQGIPPGTRRCVGTLVQGARAMWCILAFPDGRFAPTTVRITPDA